MGEQYVETLTEEIAVIKTCIADTENIEDLENNVGSWPSDSFCMLANGGRPDGFTAQTGYIKAIRTYSASGGYVVPSFFGDSNIKCHGSCGQYPDYYAEITLVSCCK